MAQGPPWLNMNNLALSGALKHLLNAAKTTAISLPSHMSTIRARPSSFPAPGSGKAQQRVTSTPPSGSSAKHIQVIWGFWVAMFVQVFKVVSAAQNKRF